MNFALVGCGFLGSIFLEEMLRRMTAMKRPGDLLLVDCDTYEERNIANQNIFRADVGHPKAAAMAELAARFGSEAAEQINIVNERIGHDNALPKYWATKPALLVDAVDNIDTRHYLVSLSMKHEIPVLHLGASQGGTGFVSWTLGKQYTSFPLHPTKLAMMSPDKVAQLKEPATTLPPCELIAFRGLGLNIGIAGAKAAFISAGMDLEGELSEDALSNCVGLTTWTANNHGHSLLEWY